MRAAPAEEEEGERGTRDEGEPRLHPEHECRHPDEDCGVAQQREERRDRDVLQHADIVGEPDGEVAGARAGVEAQWQELHLAEERLAHPRQRPRGHRGEGHGLDVARHGA